MFLGAATRSNEVYMGTEDGIVKAWAFRRLRTQDRWGAEKVLGMKGSPTKPDPNCVGADVQTHIVPAPVISDEPPLPEPRPEKFMPFAVRQRRAGLRLHGQMQRMPGSAARAPVPGPLRGV